MEENAKIFSNTLVSSKLSPNQSAIESKITKLMKSPATRAILNSAEQLSLESGISLQEAHEQIISNIKELDQLWGQVLLSEGFNHLVRTSS